MILTMSLMKMIPEIILAVDVVIIREDKEVLLIQREEDSLAFGGYWALPGGVINKDELVLEAAHRELEEETGLDLSLHGLYYYGYVDDIDRDPRNRAISFVFYFRADSLEVELKAGDDAINVRWVDIKELELMDIAFDHYDIIHDVVSNIIGDI